MNHQNLVKIIDELIKAGEAIKKIIADSEDEVNPVKIAPAQEAQAAPAAVTYTPEQVRGKFAEVAAKGLNDEVRAIITKYGATKFSNLSAEYYVSVMADLEALNNG